MAPKSLTVVLAAGLLLVGTGAGAQQYGQWSWMGSAGYRQRGSTNLIDQAVATDYSEREFKVGLMLKGFLGHPAIGSFTLGLDTSTGNYRDGIGLHSQNFGYSATLSLFPKGKLPLQLFFSREKYDLTQSGLEGATRGTANISTTFGGRLRVPQGLLRGLDLGYQRTAVGFVEQGVPDQVSESAFADWNGGNKVLRHYRLERRLYDYGSYGFTFRDTTATIDEHGPLSPLWRYDLSAVGLRRDFLSRTSLITVDTATLRSVVARTLGRGDTLDLSVNGGYSRSSTGFDSSSGDLELRYLWRPRGSWALSAYTGYGVQAADPTRAETGRFGLTVNWNRQLGGFATTVTGNASYGLVHSTTDIQTVDDRLGAYSFTASTAHGSTATLREELAVSVSRNDLRRSGEGLPQLPDFGLIVAGTGTENLSRARLSLARSIGVSVVNAFAENVRRDVTPLGNAPHVKLDEQLYGANASLARFSAAYSFGDTRLRDPSEQRIHHMSGSLSWAPWWYVTLQGTYTETTYRVAILPSFQTRRAEAGATFRVGSFSLVGTAYQVTDEQLGSPKRTYRGFVWSLARGFGGWLPIVTAPGRRGTIR